MFAPVRSTVKDAFVIVIFYIKKISFFTFFTYLNQVTTTLKHHLENENAAWNIQNILS